MDHREIGQKYDLFMFSDLSPGCPIWLDKGTTIYNILIDKIRQLNKEKGYNEVRTPVMWKPDLYIKSGHWDHYAKNMYTVQDDDAAVHGDTSYVLKPMNCPGHMMIYKSKQFSYRDLPYRISDFGTLHRNETSGAIGGLTRCRSFCQDDGHVFVCGTSKSINEEVTEMIDMVKRVYHVFGMELRVALATRPESFLGLQSTWDSAQHALFNAIMSSGLQHTRDEGGGAFYGPKIDFFVKDSQGREWQTATIQLDYQLPERFELKYTQDFAEQPTARPVVIHRAVFGSFERFIGIVLEHYQGVLPVWLAPVQAIVLPVADRHIEYAKAMLEVLTNEGVRAIVSDEKLTLNKKVALAETQAIHYILTVGDKEVASGHEVDLRLLVDDGNGKRRGPFEIGQLARSIAAHNKLKF